MRKINNADYANVIGKNKGANQQEQNLNKLGLLFCWDKEKGRTKYNNLRMLRLFFFCTYYEPNGIFTERNIYATVSCAY